MDFLRNNSFLRTYLDYVEDTESPRIFHIWSALCGISGCLGRKSFLDFGVSPMYPNLFILLVGPPATRKGTAMNITKRNLRQATKIRFAPTDTSGKRQGLIKAFEGDFDSEEEQELAKLITVTDGVSAEDMLSALGETEMNVSPENVNYIFVAASEFTTFTGSGNSEFLVFLQEMYDGESYDYRLKNEHKILLDPLMSLIGCTTPTNIADSLPAAAIGQGFMSRVLLVFGDQKYKRIARPPELPENLAVEIRRVFSTLFYEFEGPFQESDSVKKLEEKLYDTEIHISDHRFIYYIERRHTHLLKVAMCLTAARLSQTIEQEDIEIADALLKLTEPAMPDALGEFGMSPIAKGKQKLVDFLNSVSEPVTPNVLWQVMHRDMTQKDFPTALADLVNSGKINKVVTEDGPAYIAHNKSLKDKELLEALADEIQTRH